MEKKEILQQINSIFIDVMDNESIVINESTTANDIEEWDSLSHIQLIVAIEKHFNIRFTSTEILGWDAVGEIINSINSKLDC